MDAEAQELQGAAGRGPQRGRERMVGGTIITAEVERDDGGGGQQQPDAKGAVQARTVSAPTTSPR